MKDVAGVRCRRVSAVADRVLLVSPLAQRWNTQAYSTGTVNRVREQSVRSAEASAVSLIPKRLKQPPMLIAIADMIAQKNQRTQTQYRYRYPRTPACGGHHLRFKHRNACGFLVLRRLHQCYDSVRTVWCDAGFKVTLIALALSLWQITLEVIPRPTKRFHTSETTVGC